MTMTSDQTVRLTMEQRNTLAIVLSIAKGRYGVTPNQLGRRLSLSNSAAAGRLRLLREKGVVEYGGVRGPGADDGAPHRVTDAGRRYLVWGPDGE